MDFQIIFMEVALILTVYVRRPITSPVATRRALVYPRPRSAGEAPPLATRAKAVDNFHKLKSVKLKGQMWMTLRLTLKEMSDYNDLGVIW